MMRYRSSSRFLMELGVCRSVQGKISPSLSVKA
jgi:hypothetical protein